MLSSVDSLEERGREILLKLLERGSKTSSQLRSALLEQDIPEEIANRLIDRFQEVELIDDAAYAQSLASSQRATRGLSRQLVKRKLAEKGVSQGVIDQVSLGISDEDELATAIEVASKRFRQLSSLEPEVRTRRLVGFLQRRGFASSVVFSAIREAEAEAVKSEV